MRLYRIYEKIFNMIIDILSVTSAVFGIPASFIAIWTMIKGGGLTRMRIITYTVLLIATVFALVLLDQRYKQKEAEKIEYISDQNLKKDANLVANSIVITGWEDIGDYIGHLIRITGFYSRHSDKYLFEYESYKKQLEIWTNYTKNNLDRTGGSSGLDKLKGLVDSGKSNLREIAIQE